MLRTTPASSAQGQHGGRKAGSESPPTQAALSLEHRGPLLCSEWAAWKCPWVDWGRKGGPWALASPAPWAPAPPCLPFISSMDSSVSFFLFLKKYIYLFIWLRWVFVAARRLSLVEASRGYSSLRCAGFSLRWLLLLWSTGSRRVGFSSCGSWALECRLSSCGARA